jgi:glycosyltransferase involved in cell wall biosynthesis
MTASARLRPKVVHLVEALGLGGIERLVQALARHAEAARVEVICAARGGPVAAEIEAEGTPVRSLGLGSYYPWAVRRAARALRQAGADVVHSHGHFAGVLGRAAAWWAGVPAAVHHLHTIDTTLAARHRGLERVLARATSRVLCCSSAVERHAVEDLGLPPSLLLTVPNGIDEAPRIERDAARALLGGPPPPLVGCLGGLAAHKGQAVLLRAFASLARAGAAGTLVLIGDGPDRRLLEAQSGEERIAERTRFLGERADARRLLPALDLLVVPSLRREGFSLAAIEAMDAGVPVIASRTGGLPEALDGGAAGVLVEAGDADALAAAIRDLLAQPARAATLRAAGRRRVERHFRAREMARRVEAVYLEALGARRAA